ncbi:TPA: hypothetical protein HA259_04225 [Thermoplasmata archaeon]|nr:hypothetical protein [Thermoplasmata archaeon]
MHSERRPSDDFTEEERIILASLRKKTGRTCVSCRWFVEKGQHRGCYPDGKYRKFLSKSEFESGCDVYTSADE